MEREVATLRARFLYATQVKVIVVSCSIAWFKVRQKSSLSRSIHHETKHVSTHWKTRLNRNGPRSCYVDDIADIL